MKPTGILTGMKNTMSILGCCMIFFLSFHSSAKAQKSLYPSQSAKGKVLTKEKTLTKDPSIEISSHKVDLNLQTGENTNSGEKHSLYQNENGSLYRSNDNIYMEPETPSISNGGGGLYAPPPEGGNPTGGETPVGSPGTGVLIAMSAYALYILRRSKKA